MKKLFSIILCVSTMFILFAEENYLLKTDTEASFQDFSYIENFEIRSTSGYFSNKDLFILKPNSDGFRVMARNVPRDISSHYDLMPAYPAFLNEANIGAGYIDNAAAIKSVEITLKTNRPYDEVFLLYSTSPNGVIKKIKFPQNFNSVRSMEETTLLFESGSYIDDINKRELVANPVLGKDSDGIYFRGIRIQTNAPSGFAAYSEYSIVYVKEVKVVYDKMFTDEQLETKKLLKEDFNIDENVDLRNKTIEYINEKNRIKENEENLKHKE